MEKASLPPPANIWVVLSESNRIIKANLRHYLALSVLFLLPLSFTAIFYNSIVRNNHLLLQFAYVVVATLFSLLPIGAITYSVFEGFHERPVKFISAVKSSFTAFFPLLATIISSTSIIFGIFMILGFVIVFLTLLVGNSSPYFKALSVIVTIIVTLITIKLYVDWILARVVVVVESVWGFTPLKRSKSLIKGMKGVALSLYLGFGVTQSILVWISTRATSPAGAFFVLLIVFMSAYVTLYNHVVNTVLYIYCKAVHGEEYVSLPFDEGKVMTLVSVADNNV